MSASRRGLKRHGRQGRRRRCDRDERIQSPQMEKCYVCGRLGGRRSFRKRKGRLACVNVAVCTERVLNPPRPPSSGYTLSDIAKLKASTDQIRGSLGQVGDAAARAAKQFQSFTNAYEAVAAGFKPLGYMSEDGIQHHTDTP